jgi:2-dehydro-3-deoxygluconokinase
VSIPATDLLCVGEALVVGRVPKTGLESSIPIGIAGAELNVAVAVRNAGHAVSYATRVGDDPLGQYLVDEVTREGVDLLVEIDPDARTGFYLRTELVDERRAHYFRAGSAGSVLPNLDGLSAAVSGSRRLHLTGVTAALSAANTERMLALMSIARAAGAIVSFDVNFRKQLWRSVDASVPLLELARSADLVFVGRDEADALWGPVGPEQLALLLGAPEVIVKDADALTVHVIQSGRYVTFGLNHVDVLDSVGAGDAFAAGYLHGALAVAGLAQRVRYGHEFARQVLRSRSDVLDAAAVTRALSAISMTEQREPVALSPIEGA